jgi:hypothetical protein
MADVKLFESTARNVDTAQSAARADHNHEHDPAHDHESEHDHDQIGVTGTSVFPGLEHERAIVKGGLYLEALSKVDTAVLDKTGTLTLGTPEIC